MNKLTGKTVYNNLIVETREVIKKIIKDKELMEEVSFCFYNEITKYKNPTLNSLGICCVSWTILAAKLKYSYVMDFNWQFLCRTYNVNFDELIKNNVEIFEDTSLAGVANNLKISYERRESAIGWVQYYSAVSSLCLYLAGSTHIERYSGLKQLNNHKELLGYFNTIKISDIDAHLESEFIRNYIISNYPLCSDYDDIIQMEYFNRQYRNMPRKTNLNTCTKNKLIHEVLKSFLLYYKDDGEVTLVRFRVFIYYFHESLGEYSINNYEDFNEQTCIKQFNFYSQLTESYIQKGIIKSKKSYFESIIIYFYRYMIEYCEKENDLKIFSSAFKALINRKLCAKAIRGGYVPLLYNRNESPPKVEKFCIMPTVYTMNNSAANNTTIKLVDLSKVYSKYRNDIVVYLWYADGQIIDKLTDIHYLYEFLNYKEEFDEYTEKVISLNTSFKKEFCEEFLVEYRMYIESRFINAGSIKGAFKPVRKYLKYFSRKYEVNSIDLQILNLVGLTTRLGGKPITDNDLKVIYNEFVQRQNVLGNGRLYTIVFEIFINTNLRIGEILNLKRDCLMYNDMKPETATLSYFSKAGHQEIIEQEVNIKIIRLIEEAILFTEKFKDNTFMSEYLFITPIKRKILFRCKRISFYWYCKDIFKSVEDDLEIKDYKPYNIRHTFVHNAYEEGVKEGYTILEISAVTGNSFKTAVRHYRNLNYIDNYVEAFAKVIISNVDINGKILMYDDKKATNIVRDNLGNCASNHCTFEIAECLICNHFATFVNRIPEFEKKITSLNMELQKEKSNFEIEYINTEKRLLAKYLSELYKLKNNGGEDK